MASRGHHADIGGITPGSMPPHSTSLSQEGATFKSFLLVEQGRFREKELIEELMRPGQIEGSSGTRNLADNLSDLRAQIAANQKGILLVRELIEVYGLDVVQVKNKSNILNLPQLIIVSCVCRHIWVIFKVMLNWQ